jgi:hypothetical protein
VHPTLRTQHRRTRSTQQHNTNVTQQRNTQHPPRTINTTGDQNSSPTFSFAPNAPPRTLGRGRLSAMPVFG